MCPYQIEKVALFNSIIQLVVDKMEQSKHCFGKVEL